MRGMTEARSFQAASSDPTEKRRRHFLSRPYISQVRSSVRSKPEPLIEITPVMSSPSRPCRARSSSSRATRAASQTRRRWKIQINIDYTFQGQDREKMGEQIELTIDAIMRCIDLIPEETVTVSAASEEPFATITLTDIDDLLQESAGDISQGSPFFAGVRLTIPIVQHENLPT